MTNNDVIVNGPVLPSHEGNMGQCTFVMRKNNFCTKTYFVIIFSLLITPEALSKLFKSKI